MTWDNYPVSLAGDRQAAQPQHAVVSGSIVAVFSGPWADIARDAFFTAIADQPQTSNLVASAYQQAIDATAAEWDRIEAACGDEMDMFGQAGADGACIFFSGTEIHCHWLGATPIIHLRDRKLQTQNTPHTVYHAMVAEGNQPADDQLYRIKYKSFVHEQQIDSATWHAVNGDRVLLLPYTVKPSSLPFIPTVADISGRSYAESVATMVSQDCQPMATTLVLSEFTT